jgi:hypothetical protein
MEFNIFGIDFLLNEKSFGVWFFDITFFDKGGEQDSKSLFSIYFIENLISIDLLFINIFNKWI